MCLIGCCVCGVMCTDTLVEHTSTVALRKEVGPQLGLTDTTVQRLIAPRHTAQQPWETDPIVLDTDMDSLLPFDPQELALDSPPSSPPPVRQCLLMDEEHSLQQQLLEEGSKVHQDKVVQETLVEEQVEESADKVVQETVVEEQVEKVEESADKVEGSLQHSQNSIKERIRKLPPPPSAPKSPRESTVKVELSGKVQDQERVDNEDKQDKNKESVDNVDEQDKDKESQKVDKDKESVKEEEGGDAVETEPSLDMLPSLPVGSSMVECVRGHEAEGVDELSLSVGAVVTVLKEDASGWYLGQTQQGDVGLFPVSCCQPLLSTVPPPPSSHISLVLQSLLAHAPDDDEDEEEEDSHEANLIIQELSSSNASFPYLPVKNTSFRKNAPISSPAPIPFQQEQESN